MQGEKAGIARYIGNRDFKACLTLGQESALGVFMASREYVVGNGRLLLKTSLNVFDIVVQVKLT